MMREGKKRNYIILDKLIADKDVLAIKVNVSRLWFFDKNNKMDLRSMEMALNDEKVIFFLIDITIFNC